MRKIVFIGLTLFLFLLVMACAGCSSTNDGESQEEEPSINTDAPAPNTYLPQNKTNVTDDCFEGAEAIPPASATDSFEFTQSEYVKITPEDAMSMEAVFLDVRSQEEYDDGHIPGAILLPVDDINEKAEVALQDKDRAIVVYCRSGVRSERAAKELISLGYKKVFDLGGINNWTGEIVCVAR